jgi:hypothetical protein
VTKRDVGRRPSHSSRIVISVSYGRRVRRQTGQEESFDSIKRPDLTNRKLKIPLVASPRRAPAFEARKKIRKAAFLTG